MLGIQNFIELQSSLNFNYPVYYKNQNKFNGICNGIYTKNQQNMSKTMQRRRSLCNVIVLQQIQNNSLTYFSNCQKKSINNFPYIKSDQAPYIKNRSEKTKNLHISINNSKSQDKKAMDQNQFTNWNYEFQKNKFYQKPMAQSSDPKFPNQKFKKENDMNGANQYQVQLRIPYEYIPSKNHKYCKSSILQLRTKDEKHYHAYEQQISFSQHQQQQNLEEKKYEQNKVRILDQKLMKCYIRANSNKQKLSHMDKELLQNEEFSGGRKIEMIQKLIHVFETNRQLKIREMFEQRQKISQEREEKKKRCQRNLEQIKKIQTNLSAGRIDEATIIEINNLRS